MQVSIANVLKGPTERQSNGGLRSWLLSLNHPGKRGIYHAYSVACERQKSVRNILKKAITWYMYSKI